MHRHHTLRDILSISVFFSTASALMLQTARAQAVTTYHNDTLRTGWNAAETSLTVANVSGGGFNLLATTTLDSQVDAQPLIVPNQVINNLGSHAVVYVVTGGNTLYAIDGISGSILASRNFGVPVPQSSLPGQCNNNGPSIGITSTPVIDASTGTMFLITDTYENSQAIFRVHAVSLSTLQDTQAPVAVTASAKLADGTTYSFNAGVSRQRAALLLSGSTLYAAFGSYCDQAQLASRGWMLGWNKAGLTPLAHNSLTDTVPVGHISYALNSIWMSGYGPSTASAGNTVYVVTSNSDRNSYGPGNLDESVLKLSPDLSGIQSYYTDVKRYDLDTGDTDLGSGGAMLPPPQPGLNPKLLLAAGKAGSMYLFDRSASAGLGVLGTYAIGGCWCGPSYFNGSDGVGRVVTSGGSAVKVWRLVTSSSASASLTQQTSTNITSGQEGGFFTSVSSNGEGAGTAIVWAVGRPIQIPGSLPLYAIDPTSGKIIYTGVAGSWTSGNSNANTVPTVANGHVYVATNKQLNIFGIGAAAHTATRSALLQANKAKPSFRLDAGVHTIWGTIRNVSLTEMILQDRRGSLIRVYLPAAREAGNLAEPVVGQAAFIIGKTAADGLFMATNVEHAKPSSALWPTDQ